MRLFCNLNDFFKQLALKQTHIKKRKNWGIGLKMQA